ncbi:Z1 domain-containing protein [Chitinophaga caseinilytica]|uniref:Z1 domain-containing protein n=1 Tax=Chitinophaga caseinilytica TaxID=2267521 RepID=A0ABZ2ZB16_9BACT
MTRKYGPEKAGVTVKAIDEATKSIMQRLANPRRSEINYKGLVVGYVQSGKTANFTALIAKAVDAGYRFIIVLAGIHNVLRRQTQIRLDRELTGVRDMISPEKYIDAPGAAREWNRLTTAHNDFSITNLGLFSTFCERDTPTLAVVKKQTTVLNNLISYVSKAPVELRQRMPVLIIDDEADQASIDANAGDPGEDKTIINRHICRLLDCFNKKAYIGYTATPFANVLIDMNAEAIKGQEDLYPRNFVVSLPEPIGYFGASRIFKGELARSFVVEVPDEANELTRRSRVTDKLSIAIDQFLLACAVRNLRGDKMKPMSMLVHAFHQISRIMAVKKIVTEYVEQIAGRYSDSNEAMLLKQSMQMVWRDYSTNSEKLKAGLGTNNFIPEFDAVWFELANVLKSVKVVELHSNSDDSLDYMSGNEVKVIAVGGNQLSRGLTLEGLMISYYLRASRQYDTLLQMGRWFGYRHGYEDLTRVHTTATIWGFFEHLALVEEEIRQEIYRYEEENKTPLEMAIAIKGHRNLMVTSPNKMGAATERQISYSDSLNQTTWFALEKPELLRGNLNLANSFLNNINEQYGFEYRTDSHAYVAESVDGDAVLNDFLNRYSFTEASDTGGPGLDSIKLLEYISRRQSGGLHPPELGKWNIGIVSNVKPVEGLEPVWLGGVEVNMMQRSRVVTNKGYNIGVMTSPNNLRISYDENGKRAIPTLLIYLIWKGSKAVARTLKEQKKVRVDLYHGVKEEPIDLLGVAIILPESRYEPNDYIGQ